jgi:hypothetical protein
MPDCAICSVRGTVVKLGFWPGDGCLFQLIKQLGPDPAVGGLLAPTPQGVLAVPRTDNSLFVVNTTEHERPIHLARDAQDRLTGVELTAPAKLKPYQVLWLG